MLTVDVLKNAVSIRATEMYFQVSSDNHDKPVNDPPTGVKTKPWQRGEDATTYQTGWFL